jgi:NADPH2:quinone reductase
MHAYVVDGPDRQLTLSQIPKPAPARGEVLVRILACGLNFADLLMIEGRYQDTPALPFVPGLEVCGVIEGAGPDTDAPAIGTRVAIYCGHGGLAEWGCFPAAACVALPDAMPSEIAAGFQVAYGTSHLALTHAVPLRAGDRLLVLGAAGGVGLTAVEIGAHLGAEVIACARGADKLAAARAAGAHHMIDSETDDIRTQVRALGGADVVYDAVGGDQFTAALRATNPGGRILLIGFASGTVPEIRANHLLVKNVSVHGFYWGGWVKTRPALVTDSMAALFAMYGAGRLHPNVSQVLDFRQVPEGLDLLRSRAATGKVVIRMASM